MGYTEVLSLLAVVIASQGFWTFISARLTNKGARLDLLRGLAHDRIIHVGTNYVSRGWITYDEYEDYMKYLVDPYSKFGGNGLAERVIKEVESLPIRHVRPTYAGYTDRHCTSGEHNGESDD